MIRALWDRRWLAAATVALIAVVGWILAAWMLGPEVAVYAVQRGDLVKSIVATGHVETPFRVEIGSQITGTVAEVHVAEGEVVVRGQPLIALETSELVAAVVQGEGAVAQAEARLRQMRELTLPVAAQSLKQAQATLANAEAAYARAQELAATGYGTRAALDDATKNLDVARTQVRSAQLQVYTSRPDGSDYVLATTQLAQARASQETARARLGYAAIVAPRDGVLIARNVERGSVVQAGKALLVLAPAGDVQLVVQIDEKNLGLLEVGQDALASAEAYPDRRFAATLTYISPAVDITRASVEVKLTVPDPPPYLRQDMTMSVDIAVDRRASTVVVPARTIHDYASAAPWVLLMRDGRPRAQPVALGLRAGDYAEALDGVVPGDLLIPVSAGIAAGQRIRPVRP